MCRASLAHAKHIYRCGLRLRRTELELIENRHCKVRNAFCPSAAVVLVVSLFHTKVSRVQPAHASANRAKAESRGVKKKSLRRWSQRGQSMPCNTKEKRQAE